MAIFVLVLLLLPGLAHATTYYVAKGGPSNRTCPQATDPDTPRLTIASGIACLGAGDTLHVDSGTYTEQILNLIPSGTVGSPTIVKVKPGATVTIKPPVLGNYTSVVRIDRHDIILDGFILDGTNIFNTILTLGGSSTRVTIQNNTIRNMRGNPGDTNGGAGISMAQNSSFNIIRNNIVENVGLIGGRSNLVHGIYGKSVDTLIENNIVRNNSHAGIHMFHQTSVIHRNIIRGNTVYDHPSRGIIVCCGDDNIVDHNIIWGSGQPGIVIGARTNDTKVYHNTIWSNASGCITVGSTSGPTGSGAIVRNNICWQNTPNTIAVLGGHTGSQVNNNLCVNPSCVNPLFVSTANHNFTLQPTSPGVGAGVMLAGYPYVYGEPYMGAIEPVPDDPPPPPPPPPCITPLYVSTAGNDTTNDCTEAGTLGTAKRTIPAAMACACTPGTEIVVKGGTYTEQISTLTTPLVPGTNTSVRTTIRAFENAGVPETVILQLPASGGSSSMVQIKAPTDQWLHLKNLTVTCQDRFASHGIWIAGGAKRVRLTNITIHHCGAEGLLLDAGADEVEILGGDFSAPFHTTSPNIYAASNINNLLIRGATLRDALGGTRTCLHIRSQVNPGGLHTGLIVEQSIFKNCETGLYIGQGTNASIRNNLFYDNVTAIDILSGLTGSLFAYNTVTSNTLGLRCNTGASTITLQNNILFGNTTDLTNTCGATRLNNLVGIDPVFTNPGTDDYTLQNTSLAIDAALAIPGITTDFLGVSRTAYGVGPDTGAYESTAPPPDPVSEVRTPRRLTSGFFGR